MRRWLMALFAAGLLTCVVGADVAEAARVRVYGGRGWGGAPRAYYRGYNRGFNRGYRNTRPYYGGYYGARGYYGGRGWGAPNYWYGPNYGRPGVYLRF